MLNAKLISIYLGLILLLCSQAVLSTAQDAAAQGEFPNTLTLQPGMTSPKATIEDVAWITGYWQGEMWGGQTEEIWSAPLAGSMMASFKFAADEQIKFYELITLLEQNGSLVLRLKHFSAELKGWEEKDQFREFKLVKLEENTAYFEGYTYRRVNPNELHVFVVIEDQDQRTETQFVFKRKSP